MDRTKAEKILGTDSILRIKPRSEREEAIISVAYFDGVESTKRNYENSSAYKIGEAILDNIPSTECNCE